MPGMKWDMAGAAGMLGGFVSAVKLQVSFDHLLGLF
jgi:leucyl aminopeptidase